MNKNKISFDDAIKNKLLHVFDEEEQKPVKSIDKARCVNCGFIDQEPEYEGICSNCGHLKYD